MPTLVSVEIVVILSNFIFCTPQLDVNVRILGLNLCRELILDRKLLHSLVLALSSSAATQVAELRFRS